MTSNDRFTKAVDLTTGLDLPQDMALPAQRKRHVSSILKGMVDSSSEGAMERAAMATVFGVREYTQAKMFWESHNTSFYATDNSNNAQSIGHSSFLTSKSTAGITSVENKSTRVQSPASNISIQHHGLQSSIATHNHHYASAHSQQGTMSSLGPMKESGQPQSPIRDSNTNSNNSSTSNCPVGLTFSLPAIPTVSRFDDWLTTSSQILSSKAREVTPSTVEPSSLLANPIHPPQRQDQHLDTEILPPLVFFSYPPVIFDLLKSNTDDRIIIWGPDPQWAPMSGAIMTNDSLASFQPATAKLGFSSNTTTAIPAPASSLRSGGSTQNSLKSTASWINKVKQSIQHPVSSSSSSMISSNDEDTLMVMDRRLRKRSLRHRLAHRFTAKKDQHQQSHPPALSDTPTPPLVIQAATVEKLVEILTLTLDYTFMTDFFLTYRTFISPIQLCKLLILRFQWGLENDEDDRRVVRIRTFVVLRHWLLNYFIHDFTSSRQLRQTLTLFLNTLPSHSLVKRSPLDQRIVKGLKRVVRRLKKVHYPKSSSQRVQVISPPPPIFDQDQVRDIVYEKLAQGPLRRKTHEWFHKDMTLVENWHHGNMTFQDARTADILVVGSLDKSPLTPAIPSLSTVSSTTSRHDSINNHHHASSLTDPQQQSLPNRFNPNGKRQRNTSQTSIVTYAVSAFSKKRLQQQELRKVKESYLQRMEQQKRSTMMNNNNSRHHYSQQNLPNGLDHDFKQLNLQQDHSSYVSSDNSLDSMLSPGATDDELEADGEDEDADSAIASGPLEVMDDRAAQQNDSYQAVSCTDNTARQHQCYQTIHGNSTVGNYPHRRSVYNAVLSNLSPLVSPSGSVIHGPLAYNSDDSRQPSTFNGSAVLKSPQGRQLATPSSSMDNVLRLPMELNINGLEHEKVESTIVDEYYDTDKIQVAPPSTSFNQHTHQVKNRVSKSLLENGEQRDHILAGNGKMDIHDEKALVESPTSMSIKANGSLPLKLQRESESTITTSKQSQHKLSRRLINALRSGGNIKPTKATVVQPDMMMASTVASSIYQNSIVAQLDHRHQQLFNKPDTPPHHFQQQQHVYGHHSSINTEWRPYQSSGMDLQTPQQHQHPNISYLVNIRASLDEDTYHSPNHLEAEERNHPHHPLPPAPELGTIRQPSTDSIPPSLSTLFKPALVLQHRSHTLAQQFCLIEKWILLQINWEELVHCRWTKMGEFVSSTDIGGTPKRDYGSTTSYSRQQRQDGGGGGGDNEQEGGVQQLITRFNIVCLWVSSEIVRTPSLDERVLVIEKFIRLAQKCHMYSNFATLIQILLGLQSPSISRLEKTWSKVNDSEMRLLKKLSSFTSPMRNWKHIRDSMTVVAEEYGMSPKEIQIQLPDSSDRHQLHQTKIKLPFGGCIPFLGLYLSDLVFNSEQPSYLEPNHDHHKIYQSYTQSSSDLAPALLRQPLVNFRKHRITATIIKRFLTFRDLASRYSFEPIDSLYSDCFYLDALETNMLSQLSLIIEPPAPPSPPPAPAHSAPPVSS